MQATAYVYRSQGSSNEQSRRYLYSTLKSKVGCMHMCYSSAKAKGLLVQECPTVHSCYYYMYIVLQYKSFVFEEIKRKQPSTSSCNSLFFLCYIGWARSRLALVDKIIKTNISGKEPAVDRKLIAAASNRRIWPTTHFGVATFILGVRISWGSPNSVVVPMCHRWHFYVQLRLSHPVTLADVDAWLL